MQSSPAIVVTVREVRENVCIYLTDEKGKDTSQLKVGLMIRENKPYLRYLRSSK